MRVLVIHNMYSSRVPSGENLSVFNEVTWLREAGVEVHLHETTNDQLFGRSRVDQLGQAVWSVWSSPAKREIEAVIDDFAPDLVHVHNLFPLLTASVPATALRLGLPVVWTARNTRVVCVNGTYFRDEAPCHECRPGWRVPGIRYGCYGSSPVPAALVTGATSLYRRLARRRVTTLAISDSMRRWLVDTAGFDPERVHVKYNGVAEPPTDLPLPPPAANRTFVFAGQLIAYKGLQLLLDAWRRADLPDDVELRIVGSGRQADLVAAAAATDPRITQAGHVPAPSMPAQFAAARAVVVPSTWDEPFGRVAAEAQAYGRPVLTTGLGGLGEIVDDTTGWVTGADVGALAAALAEAARSDEAVTTRGEAAHRRHAQQFSPAATTRVLLDRYEASLRAHAQATETSPR
ncbi:MAG TPA: glycosyltransferase family 4 protein [Acidimicrobiales bacterium]|nr:glycosyltransferase family 4 protein [Acidimicrobiales bacterium]